MRVQEADAVSKQRAQLAAKLNVVAAATKSSAAAAAKAKSNSSTENY